MRKHLSIILSALMLVSVLASCGESRLTSVSSSEIAEEISLYTRLVGEEPDESVTLACGEDAAAYADMSSLRDDGYIIRRTSNELFILGKTEDGLDRGVRYYANHSPKSGGYSYTYGEGAKVKKITVCGNDISEYKIWLDPNADYLHTYAAEELVSHIGRACGYYPEIVYDEPEHYFAFDRVMQSDSRYADYGDEGFSFAEKDGNIVIVCGELRGCIYGVYEFLEDYLGWRFFCDWETFCIHSNTLDENFTDYLYDADISEIPSGLNTEIVKPTMQHRYNFRTGNVQYGIKSGDNRQMMGNDAYNGQRINRPASHGLIPFLKLHAEYWNDSYAHPCFSDEDMTDDALAYYVAEIQAGIDAGKTIGYDLMGVDVAQPDCWNFCKCKKCVKIENEEKSQAGPVIRFTNYIADALNEEYPGIIVNTFAYMGSTKPTVTHPSENVCIAYCFFNDHNKMQCYAHSLTGEECSNQKCSNIGYAEDIRGWCEICDNVQIWWYPGIWSFSEILSSSISNVTDEIRFFNELGINGIYACPSGCSWSGGGYNQTEETIIPYLANELIWHPDMTDEEIAEFIRDYLHVLCGEGYEEMYQYYNLVKTWDVQRCWTTMPDGAPNERIAFKAVKKTFDGIIELFDTARDKATSKAQEEFVDKLSRTAYYTGLCATHSDWYVNGTAEQKAHYEELYNKFLDINDRLPLKFGGYQQSLTTRSREQFNIEENPGVLLTKGTYDENWWDN